MASWVLAWVKRRSLLPVLAHLMALGHFSTQVVLGMPLLSMAAEERRAVIRSLAHNPLLHLEGIRLVELVRVALGETSGSPGAQLALLVGLDPARWPLLSRRTAGIVAAYALGGRVDGLYMAPVALLTALAAGLEVEALALGKMGRLNTHLLDLEVGIKPCLPEDQ